MTGAIKHMERSHRAAAAKRNSGTFNHFYRNAHATGVARQHLKDMLKRAAGKES